MTNQDFRERFSYILLNVDGSICKETDGHCYSGTSVFFITSFSPFVDNIAIKDIFLKEAAKN